ncbi:unnamed protein product [Paramecium sonneborni]|uniref:Uncharacterized protein n=1 Tax=Paramecium sonneborni TaxID=65129 RepID=A0A8S1QMD5_9CILI|nr:unnamed protein product [Paramecium sonneborni]
MQLKSLVFKAGYLQLINENNKLIHVIMVLLKLKQQINVYNVIALAQLVMVKNQINAQNVRMDIIQIHMLIMQITLFKQLFNLYIQQYMHKLFL